MAGGADRRTEASHAVTCPDRSGRCLSSRYALWAASAAVVRRDLWAESAFTYANLEWANTTKVKRRAFDEASTSATAISLKLGNSGVWLMPVDPANPEFN